MPDDPTPGVSLIRQLADWRTLFGAIVGAALTQIGNALNTRRAISAKRATINWEEERVRLRSEVDTLAAFSKRLRGLSLPLRANAEEVRRAEASLQISPEADRVRTLAIKRGLGVPIDEFDFIAKSIADPAYVASPAARDKFVAAGVLDARPHRDPDQFLDMIDREKLRQHLLERIDSEISQRNEELKALTKIEM